MFTVMGCRPHAQPPSWRTTPCRLSATAYSIYSQLSSISGGPSLTNIFKTGEGKGAMRGRQRG